MAQIDVTTAYNALAGQPYDVDLTGQDLGGLTLTPGVYRFSSSAQLTGTLTLNALGDPNAVFVFQIGSTLTTASSSTVRMININGGPCNVFWQIGSSATLGTTTSFVGNILALTSITLNTDASVNGRALARNGAVTLDTNNVSITGCSSAPSYAGVSGYKWHDVDRDGVRDAGEPGVNGMRAEIRDAGGNLVGSTVTANDAEGLPGYYRFASLSPGSYTVSEVCAPAWSQSYPAPQGGVCGTGVQRVVLVAGQAATGNFGNFQLEAPAEVPEASTLLLLGSGLAGLAGYASLRIRSRRRGK